jgi:glucuronate isomerase
VRADGIFTLASPEGPTDMSFLDGNYLLETPPARDLYDRIADEPIVDPHTHADIEEIVEDDGWSDV